MSKPIRLLTDKELIELDAFMTKQFTHDDAMTLDALDGYFHALAIGPSTMPPSQWLPLIWGGDTLEPPVKNVTQVNRLMDLLTRHYNGVLLGLETEPPTIDPLLYEYESDGIDYTDAQGWALGFIDGMRLNWNDWQPLLQTPQGAQWYTDILHFIQTEDLTDQPSGQQATQARLTRADITQVITNAVRGMYHYWLPQRLSIQLNLSPKKTAATLGRNELCSCGSGKKFKKCCGFN